MIEPLLTPRDAAEILGISVEDVWSLCRRGELPSIKLGSRYGRTRIRPEDLRAFQRGRAR